MDIKELALSLSPLERKVLPFLEKEMPVEDLVSKSGLLDVEVRRALLWLSNREIVSTSMQERDEVILLPNGLLAQQEGLSELRILRNILVQPKYIQDLEEATLSRGEIMATIGVLKANKAAEISKDENGMKLAITQAGKDFAQSPNYEPEVFLKTHAFPLNLTNLSDEEKKTLAQLKKRKDFIKTQTRKDVTVQLLALGERLVNTKIDFSDVEEKLTSEMITSGSWKNKTFRTYDVESPVPSIAGGRRHPNREAMNIIRDIYLQMGFNEMKGPWVETSFWCMDSMWIPQDHPARDAQDTFFLGKKGTLPDKELVAKVKRAHEDGLDTGSTGYQKPWDEELSKELILRTHSTATTFRKLAEIGDQDGKYFYIANVFRNEAVDTTHLAEFLQAEGFVIGDNLTLSDLMGFIKEFYARLGIHKIRFKPTYNPYTEPSLEAHYYDEAKGKWYALINSGIFRPESLAPYGIKKTVIAWGMGASRVASILNHKNNLRELVGPTVNFEWIATHKTPQPRLDK